MRSPPSEADGSPGFTLKAHTVRDWDVAERLVVPAQESSTEDVRRSKKTPVKRGLAGKDVGGSNIGNGSVVGSRRSEGPAACRMASIASIEEWKEKRVSWWERWRMPFTLENWRWGLQEALTIALLMWPCCVPRVDQLLFNGNARWVVASATPVIEGTAGGTARRMIDRVLGTAVAGTLVVVALSVSVGVHSERSDNWGCIFALYILISLCGFVYNWLLFALPTHPLVGITAAFQTPIILSGSVFTGSGVLYASWRAITVVFGVLVSGIISRYFLPRRARLDIINGLARILDNLADALQPLVHLESGLLSSPSFFNNVPATQDPRTGIIHITDQNWQTFKHQIWKTLEMCGKLTNEQLVMVGAARTEVSIRKKNAFFQDEHREALVNIRTLFYHVASLYYLIDTQVAGCTDFDDEDLVNEIEHWSKFGLLDIQKNSDTNAAGKEAQERSLSNLSIMESVAGLEEKSSPVRKWVCLYGPTINVIITQICRALKAASRGLLQNTFPLEAEMALRKAGESIGQFHRQRAERQQATAIFVEYAVHGQHMVEDDPAFIERFEGMLGVSIAEYEGFGEEQQAAFWQSYWVLRDRLSTCDTDVMTLFVAVRTAVAAVEKLIKARRAKLSRGEDLNHNLDLDRVEAEQQAAIQKAGAANAFKENINITH